MTRKNTSRAAVALVAALALAGLASAARAGDPWHLMPEAASAEAGEVDGLTYLVLWITGVTFVLVQVLIVMFLVKYRKREGQRAKYTHGNHAVELVWTVTPALILVFLALYQMNLWMKLKAKRPEDNQGATAVQVFAKQFEWNFRYPDPEQAARATTDEALLKAFDSAKARLTVNAVVVPVNHPVNATLRSMDVIHSFFLPNFRFKQDAVPGLTIPFWFRPTVLSADRQLVLGRDAAALANGEEKWVEKKVPYWDIVCAELCGHSHTGMGAQLFVVSEADYAKWQKDPSSVPGLPTWTLWNKDNAMGAPDTVWTRWEWQDKKFDADGRIQMGPAKLKREPFGEDQKPAGAQSKPEDM